ncbi:tripartite tricarboxylate transporter TctB family protein [Ensifer sp. Root127]|uniref:tripartite tricarboxylate transporter TctB family protein n=1 Tax=Ensifer sp. Root127 TaxID=1736440 RepID=UPI00070A9FA1|nr:tripartite tricarboxylate transporter TctB family protein [Ensifer sp. Root127]KQW72743.1 tricarboxylic transporter [Ensifer sp. Root127]
MPPPIHSKPALPELTLSIGVLLVAGVIAWQTSLMAVSPLYAKVGPTVFPYLTAAGLTVLAVSLLWSALRGGWQDEEEKSTPPDWRSIAYVAAGLVANVVLIGSVGFTAASVIMFVLIARGFGSRRPMRDAACGLLLALAAYFGFAKLLGVNIGGGVVESLLGG